MLEPTRELLRTGCRVGTKIEEELEESEACEERSLAKVVDFTSENAQEERGHEEAHELEVLTTNNVDGEQGEIVAGKETKCRDDNLVENMSVNDNSYDSFKHARFRWQQRIACPMRLRLFHHSRCTQVRHSDSTRRESERVYCKRGMN